MFSVFTMADFIASSLERPFCIDLQYFFVKLFEILFWSKIALGSVFFKAFAIGGLTKKSIRTSNPKKILNNIHLKLLTIL